MESKEMQKSETEQKREEETARREEIKEMGTLRLEEGKIRHRIQLLTIIGEIEGHEAVSGNTKATKYEHLLPKLAEAEDSDETEGILILLNTLGGDVEAGLAIAEMIASLSRLFIYCSERHDDHSSGAVKWDVHRCLPELP